MGVGLTWLNWFILVMYSEPGHWLVSCNTDIILYLWKIISARPFLIWPTIVLATTHVSLDPMGSAWNQIVEVFSKAAWILTEKLLALFAQGPGVVVGAVTWAQKSSTWVLLTVTGAWPLPSDQPTPPVATRVEWLRLQVMFYFQDII